MKKQVILTIIIFALSLFLLSAILPQFIFIDDSCYEGFSKLGPCTNYERVNIFAKSIALVISLVISFITFKFTK